MKNSERIAVLMYHRIGESRDESEADYCVSPGRFAAQMQLLASRGYRAVPIDAFVAWLAGGPALNQGDFILTFDDGYRDLRDHALPVLLRLGWAFTVFLVTDLLGKRDAWGRLDRAESDRYPLLSSDDVLAMRQMGCNFHSHSRTHTSLTTLNDQALADELSGSRAAISALLGVDRPAYLAYPYGHVDDRVEAAAQEAGYQAAFSVQPGFNRQDANPYSIRRLDVVGTDTPATLLRKIRLGSNNGSLTYAANYYLRSIARRARAVSAMYRA